MNRKTVAVANAMWTRQAIMSYIDGGRTLSWIIGVIEAADDVEAARRFIDELDGYGDPERRENLLRRLEAQAA